jgi:hypothetical protein
MKKETALYIWLLEMEVESLENGNDVEAGIYGHVAEQVKYVFKIESEIKEAELRDE